jgi:hypothetical protein
LLRWQTIAASAVFLQEIPEIIRLVFIRVSILRPQGIGVSSYGCEDLPLVRFLLKLTHLSKQKNFHKDRRVSQLFFFCLLK